MRIFDRLDATDFNGVMHDMNPHGAVLAQEYAVVDADVSKLVPATIKAVLVELLLHQLHKDFLLEGHLVYNFILNLLCGFLDRCWLCLQLLMVHERDWSFS